jgi:hypothetical protein
MSNLMVLEDADGTWSVEKPIRSVATGEWKSGKAVSK